MAGLVREASEARGSPAGNAGNVLSMLALVQLGDSARVEPEVACIARHHALGIAQCGQMVEVTNLKGLKHALAHPEHAGRLRDGEPQLTTPVCEELGELRTLHVGYTSLNAASAARSSSRPSASRSTSLGLDPSGGPTTPLRSRLSMILPALAYPTLRRRCRPDVEPS